MLKVLSFRLSGELFGIEINNVKEINRNIEYTAVPRSQKNIAGIFNMRGQIVTIFNLAGIIGYNDDIYSDRVTCIILKSESGNSNYRGIIIERTGDVIDVTEDMCEPPPANIDSVGKKYIKDVVRLENDLLRIIDTDLVFSELILS
ncbi:chemotaxis protein CheW [Pseudobacteroides cellulosolvens]|uniref:CheW protein n=1 Tax=Pseudobacteroides cellulosolvens ATCC 35603 = DSM 2933 TaxID=398512 RepID=A0A0L6JV07_9FIRM|nr:chemotaxis protein CheW [Pseudobacteroides cellulosolvens]KNY29559.1 CheW protein [Pseudobacteroides cellulosolvens ATCC 35603 = DSM 2933]